MQVAITGACSMVFSLVRTALPKELSRPFALQNVFCRVMQAALHITASCMGMSMLPLHPCTSCQPF